MEKDVYKLHLLDKYFNLIKNGTKRVEIRLNDEKRKNMKVGNNIEFINNDTEETIMTEIVNKRIFNTINDLFDVYTEKELGISRNDIESVIYSIYSKKEIEENKICALEIKTL